MRPPPDTAKASPEEERLRSLILSLQTESAILERLVYKNKNQHRRCPYFQALLKVRRDVRLLQSAGLGEILHVLIPVIDGRKPAQSAYVTMRLKRKHPSGKHNYQERLLGVARLLSQMAEPILKAAIQISFLLAKSFFTGFSVTILALLARLRVLVQQILLEVVSVFNKVSSLSQKKQSVKLIGEGIEAFREYYPTSGDAHHTLTLECVWEEDKFVLFERTNNIDIKKSDEDQGAVPLEAPIQYETMDLFNEADDSNKSLTSVQSSNEDMSSVKTQNDTARDLEPIDGHPSINLSTAELEMHGVAVEITHCEDERKSSVSKSRMDVGSTLRKKKAAFVSVSKPKLSDTNTSASNKKMKLDLHTNDANAMKTDDPFLSLLLGGCTNKNRLF